MGVWIGTAFPSASASQWVNSLTPTIWIISLLYLAIVLYVPSRIKPIQHGLLPVWYRFNGIFQMILLMSFLPSMLISLSNGWTASVCSTGTLYTGTVSGTIIFLFVCSKVFDLFETILIISEGRRPLTLHIVHHIISLLYTWHGYVGQHSIARWFSFVNLFSHVVLYSYLSPIKFGFNPCWLMVCAAQMGQLVLSLLVSITAQDVLNSGGQCDVDAKRLPIDKLVIFIFIVLFADFYHGRWRKFRATKVFVGNRKEDEEISEKTVKNGKKSSSWQKTGITPSERSYSSK